MAERVDITLKRLAWNSTLHNSEELLQLDIRDNGRGTDLNRPNALGLGLVGIRERVHILGGSCTFNSAPGKGMHVSVLIPRSGDGH
jgi:signal transduction histidine kinase